MSVLFTQTAEWECDLCGQINDHSRACDTCGEIRTTTQVRYNNVTRETDSPCMFTLSVQGKWHNCGNL